MKYFETISDPRVLGCCKYRLCDILFISLAIYVCGGEDYTDMHEFAIERAEALKDFVQFEDGVPSVDTFERVLGLIEPNSLNACSLARITAVLVGAILYNPKCLEEAGLGDR